MPCREVTLDCHTLLSRELVFVLGFEVFRLERFPALSLLATSPLSKVSNWLPNLLSWPYKCLTLYFGNLPTKDRCALLYHHFGCIDFRSNIGIFAHWDFLTYYFTCVGLGQEFDQAPSVLETSLNTSFGYQYLWHICWIMEGRQESGCQGNSHRGSEHRGTERSGEFWITQGIVSCICFRECVYVFYTYSNS